MTAPVKATHILRMSFPDRNYTTERLSVDVLPQMQDGVRAAAQGRGLSQSAYLRRVIGSALALDGIAVPIATADTAPMRVVELRADQPTHINAQTGERQWR